MRSLSISAKLVSSYMLLAVVVIIASGTGLYLVNTVVGVLNKITDEVTPTIESVDDLVMNLWESNKVAEEILADEDIADIETLSKEVDELDKQFDQAYIEVQELVTDKDLLDEMEIAKKEQAEFGNHTREMIQSHLNELEKEILAKKLLDEFDGIGAELLVMLDEFSEKNEAEMALAEEEGDKLEASGFASAADINKILGELFDKDYPVVEAALKLETLIMVLQDTAGEFLAEERPEQLPAIRKNFEDIFSRTLPHLKTLIELAETDEDKQDTEKLEERISELKKLALDDGKLFSSYENQLTEEYNADRFTELLETDADNAAKALDVIASKADRIADGADDIGIVKNAAFILSLVAIAGLLFSVIMGIVMARMIIKPINSVVAGLKDAADGEGDLTKRLEVKSTDEVGELSRYFNSFIEKVQLIIRDLAANAEHLSASSVALSNLSGQMTKGAENASQKTNSVAHSTDEMSQNMTSVAAAMEQASTNIQMIAAAAEEMTATITEIAANSEKGRVSTENAVEQTDMASHQVGELGQAAQEIGKVVETITDISEQVNLLALNATIEAARAGDAGKGFAVVANEIKELAKQTADATGEIRHRVESIQTTTDGTISQIKNINGTVKNVDEIVSTIASAVEEQSVTTKEIANNVAQASTGIEETNQNVAENNMVVTTISEEIADVNSTSDKIAESCTQVSRNSEELAGYAETLSRIVGRFVV